MSDPGRTIARELAEQGARYPNAGASAILSALVKDGYAVVELPNVSRDDLARIAEILRDRFPFVSAAGLGEIAAEIGAALHPRIETPDQLHELPHKSVVLAASVYPFDKYDTMWWHDGVSHEAEDVPLPAIVLYTPESS